ncbi:hypothetical protein ACFOEY_04800 [Paracandidimonas soli]|uniref:hypothetical protein n=1 Tax=Paracandidimonas soli TaxID=1917182 RepID=UPI003608B83B
MQQGRQQQESAEATQGRLNAAPGRRSNPLPLRASGSRRLRKGRMSKHHDPIS